MRPILICAHAIVAFLLAAAPPAAANPADLAAPVNGRPITVGETLPLTVETPHPYPAGGRAGELELVWSKEIHFPGATYIAPHFAQFQLAEGDVAVVRSPDGEQLWTYRGLGRAGLGLSDSGFFATHIKGETAVVELYASGRTAPGYGLRIDRFGRGYNDAEILDLWDQGLGPILNLPEPPGYSESICTVDDSLEAKCYQGSHPTAYARSQAVVRLLLNGFALCTGWLIGDQGHVMTNQHCIGSQATLNNVDFELGAEGATCATDCRAPLACPGTIEASGGVLVAVDAPLDYSLVLPDTSTAFGTDLPATYGYLQLRQAGAVVNEEIYLPGHPAGWGKRISLESSYPGDGGFARVVSVKEPACTGGPGDVGYWADTQGGSSGSPVLSRSDHKVVALHHCRGADFCASGNPTVDDPNRGVPIEAVIADLGKQVPNCALPLDLGLSVVRKTATTATTVSAFCPSGKVVVGGGCADNFTSTRLQESYPVISSESWGCRFASNPGSLSAYAVCADAAAAAAAGRQVVAANISTTNTPSIACPSGKVPLSGGCQTSSTARLRSTWPLAAPPTDGWACSWDGGSLSARVSALCVDADACIGREVRRFTTSGTNSPHVTCPAGKVAAGGGCADNFTSTQLRSAWPLGSPFSGFDGFACVHVSNPGSLSAYAICVEE